MISYVFNVLNFLSEPLKVFEEFGLSPLQAFIVIGMLAAGAVTQWQFQHRHHVDDDNEHEH